MKEKIFDSLCYLVLIGLIVAQCVIGRWYLMGQGIYLLCNIIMVIRDIVLKRTKADKIKDCSCTAITMGLILLAIGQKATLFLYKL